MLWGLSSIAAAQSSRLIGAGVAVFWVFLVGFGLVLPVSLASGPPDADWGGAAWAAGAVLAAVGAMVTYYAALRRGAVSIVVPITASQGAIAALIAVALGEALGPATAAGLVAVVAGAIVLTRRPGRTDEAEPQRRAVIAVAVAAAVLSGLSLYCGARAAGALGTPWFLVAMRCGGVACLGLALGVRRRFRAPGRAWRYVVFAGVADTTALASYAFAAARGGVVVPAVIASQFGAVAIVAGVVHFGERLSRAQTAGAVLLLSGVAVVTAAQL